MLKIGITGNIGSGKSTVADLFSSFDIPIYDADSRAKWLMSNDNIVKNKLIDAFGSESFTQDGKLNRVYLSQSFKDPQSIEKLNSIVHPAVFENFEKWCLQQSSNYVLKESALLIETGFYKNLDGLILVCASEENRIQRAMKRDSADRESILNRMKYQIPQEDKIKLANWIIKNDDEDLISQVNEIHKEIIKIKK